MNAAWWARNSRRYYIPLLRWYRGQADATLHPTARIAASLGTCYYRVGLFQEWERSLRLRGIKTAREIEQGIRVDPASSYARVWGHDSEYDILRDRSIASSRAGSK